MGKAMRWWRAAVLAALVAGTFALTGCDDTAPTQTPPAPNEQPGGGY
jgi:hypothetical protein